MVDFAVVGFFGLLGLGATVAGGGLIYRTYQNSKTASAIELTGITSIRDISPGDGIVQVHGRVQPDSETVDAAIVDTEAVIAVTTVSKWGVEPMKDEGPANTAEEAAMDGVEKGVWHDQHNEYESVRFEIDDGIASVPVRPPSGNVGNTGAATGTIAYKTEEVVVNEGETPPAVVKRYLDATEELEAAPDAKRRYAQSVIEVGEPTFIGAKTTSEDRLLLTADDSDAEPVIAHESQSEVADRVSAGQSIGYAAGTIIVLVGLGILDVAVALL